MFLRGEQLMRPINKVFAISVFLIAFLVAAGTARAAEKGQYFKLPLSFEANLGQSASDVNFLAHGPGYVLHLAPSHVVVAMRDEAVTMDLVGASHNAQAEGVEPLPGIVNYYLGNDASLWKTGIPTYAKT